MSDARNTLLDLFLYGGDGSQPEFEQALDDYALELAGRIRDQAWPHERDERENRLIHELADLIDPEVPNA
ncbi:hypothetical protein [Streptomyces cyaneofuscatus]|uniref:hypothetical protein n=1 Tax=Streptomyces cyaneofuscatus TaxID=66883 RepID=UPI00344394E9